jgi:hypothetical protein
MKQEANREFDKTSGYLRKKELKNTIIPKFFNDYFQIKYID